jgi:hypothetical protein
MCDNTPLPISWAPHTNTVCDCRNRDSWWTVVSTVIITECMPQKQGISSLAQWLLISEEGICRQVKCCGIWCCVSGSQPSERPYCLHAQGQVAQELCFLNFVVYLSSVLNNFSISRHVQKKVWRVIISFITSVCLCIHLHGTTWFPVDGFPQNLILKLWMIDTDKIKAGIQIIS